MRQLFLTLLTLSFLMPLSAQTITIARSGTQPSRQGPVENFTGSVRVDPLFQTTDATRATGSLVTFDAGAHSAWHMHPLGQVLIVTTGTGRVQQWGQAIDEIRVGDVVRIPPNTKHWHGAAPTTTMAHIAIVEQPATGNSTVWMEKVSQEQYNMAVRGQSAPAASALPAQPTAAQRIVGNFAPKLGELTDEVLFGDVWARPQLSPRDRSMVTVSALVAMNRPDQLRSHLVRARENGMTEQELAEVMTHLAFYAGWPNALTAVTVARDVFEPARPAPRP
ncbi:MAG TPA: carboxymuconolactone decarboxylase family protein [Thermoanaerobaculia bacterium]|jgi:4-carboxymuconolactone decarboxylase|nr:carboxymuconolactone decarboxylase family protein [Thermoanaerobaculia bacterium]